MQILIIP